MDAFVAYTVVGLSLAAIYAVVSSGLVLTYSTTGVFNFAHGAAGMLAAFSYWQLTIGWGWPVAPALVVVLFVLAPGFGLLIERFVLRPVQDLGEAERLVMTIALLSGSIAAARWIWDPNVPRPLPVFFADRAPMHLGPATVTWHQIITVLVAFVVAGALFHLLTRTRAGAEMRATVDDRALVGLTGADPLRANRLAWVLSTQLAAVGGILIAPTISLDAAQLSLLIVNAYTAAIFGRLRSLPLTFLGAVVVGLTEAYLSGYLPQNAYLPGLRLAAPALLLLIALLLFPHRRLRHRTRRLVPVPQFSLRGSLLLAGGIVALGLVLAAVLGDANRITYGAVFSLGIVALSFVPLTGYAGQISLCQLSMAGIGAVAWGRLGAEGQLWALVAAFVVPALVGALIALPALRLSGIYLALGTAALAVILDRWIFNLPAFDVFGTRVALFSQGSIDMAPPDLLGWSLDSPGELLVFGAVVLALATVAVSLLRGSRTGRRLIALRDSEAAYATLGGNLLPAKALVFGLSAGIAGVGGAVYGMQQQAITADQFSFVNGLPIFLVAVIGGLGMVADGLFAGLFFVVPAVLLGSLSAGLQNVAALLPALAGIGLGRSPQGILAMIRRPRSGSTTSTAEEIPVEWWGIKRDWRPEDEEVLDRGLVSAG